MKLIDWFFYIIGVIFCGNVLHELYHVAQCGGEWVAGVGNIQGEWFIGGATFCTGGDELIPTTLEIAFYIYFLILRYRSR